MSITLKLGMHDNQTGSGEVLALQKALVASGALAPKASDQSSNLDGKFGRITEQAVKDFQSKNGLNPDGVVGAATRAALNLSASALPAADVSPLHVFNKNQLAKLAETLDALVPTGWFDLIDDAAFLWIVNKIDAVLAANLPAGLVKILNDLSLGSPDAPLFKRRIAQLLNDKINIPLMDEETEEKILTKVVDFVAEALNLGSSLDKVLGK